MCLSTIETRVKRPTIDVVVGWKVFVRNGGNYFGELFTEPLAGYEIGKWYAAKRGERIKNYCDDDYSRGFHFYYSRAEARRQSTVGYVVMKVEVRRLHTVGTQSGAKVGVAREMRIVPRKGRSGV